VTTLSASVYKWSVGRRGSGFVQVGFSSVIRSNDFLNCDSELDAVIRRMNQVLLCTEIPLGRLH
jgi:hypothetical protein